MEGPGESHDGFETEAARDLDILETGAPRRWRLVGEMCAAHADRLAAALAPGARAEGDLTLDLRDVTFLDTMGLHVIAEAAIQLGDNGSVILVAAQPWVQRVLLLSGVDTIPNVELRAGPA